MEEVCKFANVARMFLNNFDATTRYLSLVRAPEGDPGFAMVVDGKSLLFFLQDDRMKAMFLDMAINAFAVI